MPGWPTTCLVRYDWSELLGTCLGGRAGSIPAPLYSYTAIVSMDRSETMWHLPETLREFEQTGDETIVLELIDSFQNDTAHRFERLHDAVARLDAATVKAEAHAVGGSARQMGAEALADLCQGVKAAAPPMTWLNRKRQREQPALRFAESRTAMSEF